MFRALLAITFWVLASGAFATTTVEQAREQAEAFRWSQQADFALAPLAADRDMETAQWVRFWLTADDLEALLETALARHRNESLVLAGGRVHWNPLRPWYDRIFAIDLWHEEGYWQSLAAGERMILLVIPEVLLQQLRDEQSPWLPAPVLRMRSGQIQLHPVSVPEGNRVWEEWRVAEASVLLPTEADGIAGFQRVLGVHPDVWLGRSSLHGWLTALIVLLLLMLLLLLCSPLRRKSS